MADIIYNEGRVAGFSAYETYVRQHLSEYGNDGIEPASEREWLSSMLAGGSAVIIKVPSGISSAVSHNTGWFYLDIQLPNTQSYMNRLCAANTIAAYFFMGQGNYSNANFPLVADSVASYGDLISNTSASHPSGTYSSLSSIPTVSSATALNAMKHKADLYAKIIDGIVVQPGTWSNNPNAGGSSPYALLIPDLNLKSPGIRLQIAVDAKADFDSDVEILLVGWTNRAVVAGEVGLDIVDPAPSASSTPHPADGDFLGPACFPWASKIMFVSPSYSMYWVNESLEAIEDDLEAIHGELDGVPIISTEYADISISGVTGYYTTAPKGLLVVHKKTKVPNTDPPQYTTENTYALALDESDRRSMNIADSTNVVNSNPDGYIYWEHLLPALHKKVNNKYGKIDALTSFLRQLSNVLSTANDGEYVINISGGNITVSPYIFSDDEMSKFQLNLIPYLGHLGTSNTYKGHSRLGTGYTTTGNAPMFGDVKLDLFGYQSVYNNGGSVSETRTLNMLATLTMIENPAFQFGSACDQWYQVFFIDDATNLKTLLNVAIALRNNSVNSVNKNSILIASGGRPMMRNASEDTWSGGCWTHTDIMAYIRIVGICNAIPATATEAISVNPSSAKVHGVIYGRSDLLDGSGIPYASSGSFSSCAVTGAIGITDRKGGNDNWPNSGSMSVTFKLANGNTQTVNISLS